jgi:hypothetical protein
MTKTQRTVLTRLMSGGAYPDDLYPVIFPSGRFNTDIDTGSSKGGPSRREYAVAMYMGRLGPLVYRYGFLDKLAHESVRGRWVITAQGRQALARGYYSVRVKGKT